MHNAKTLSQLQSRLKLFALERDDALQLTAYAPEHPYLRISTKHDIINPYTIELYGKL